MRTTRLRTQLTTAVNTLAGLGERKSISSITPTAVNYVVNPVPAHPIDFNSTSLFGGFRSSGQKSRTIINHTSNVFSKQTNYRHTTQMVIGQPVRFYSTLPSDIMGVVRNAPKTSYGGDNLSAYLRPQPTTDAEAEKDVPQFAYLVNSGTRFIWSAGIRLLAFKFLHSISASAEVLALATIEVDVSKIDPGKTITITWRGKPVFIKHRTTQEIEDIRNTPLTDLKDPQRDEERVKDENWSVLLAICTHLGCVPVTDAGAYNAFFCPCHGSHYDASGRIRRGPAPLNLEVPKHTFAEGGKMIVLG